jgi:hypothetical protein
MTEPTTVRVEVPAVSNVIEMGELLRALRDFADRRTGPTPPVGPAASRSAAAGRDQALDRVRELATELAELVDRIPDLPGGRPAAP